MKELVATMDIGSIISMKSSKGGGGGSYSPT